jgi:predicted Zn-ribbon and HTH transcriptional regulator
MTIRQEIISLLTERRMTVRELAIHFHVPTDDIAEDLLHIGKSIYPKLELKMAIPVCKRCGFQFKERSKLRPPSKCPRCKHEKITEPRFWIEAQKV